MLQADDLSYRVPDGPHLLQRVSFTAARGEWLGLIGPNGAGKTSLLRLLSGWLMPSAGRIWLDGRALSAYGAQERARRLAYMPQTRHSAWDLSVRAIVRLGRLAHHAQNAQNAQNAAADEKATDEALTECGLMELAARRWRSLSGGERARVMLARALNVRAPWLLADEPFAGLDVRHQLQMTDLLRQVRAQGIGGVIAVHDVSLAARCCTRFLLLAQGRALGCAPLAQLQAQGLLRRAFGVRLTQLEQGGARALVPHWPQKPLRRRRIAKAAQNR